MRDSHQDFYWPDGTLAYQRREYVDCAWTGGGSYFYGFQSKPVFEIGYIPPGNGQQAADPAGPYMNVDNSDSGKTSLRDGPVTLWGTKNPDLLDEPGPVDCQLQPVATGRIKKGKLVGTLNFDGDFCPFTDFHFRKGKLLEKSIPAASPGEGG
jgi:hypothetical protein